MIKKMGRASIRGAKIYFDDAGWAILKEVARKQKKSPRFVMMAALKRLIRTQNGQI